MLYSQVMRVGFHVSISGGFERSVIKARRLGCEALQIFSHSPRSWRLKEIENREKEAFIRASAESGLFPIAVHMPYLPNLATENKDLYLKSVCVLEQNIARACLLEADFLVLHPGNFGKGTPEKGIRNIANAINRVLTPETRCRLLLENTAGQGTEIGHHFFQLKSIVDRIHAKDRIGLCLDTAHAFAAGYDLSTEKGCDRMLEEIDRLLGIGKLYFLHFNDTRAALGSRSDRHWHIGKGHIGTRGFRHMLNHPAIRKLAGVMETPGKTENEERCNMKMLRTLMKT